jgi:hypothetical protein
MVPGTEFKNFYREVEEVEEGRKEVLLSYSAY